MHGLKCLLKQAGVFWKTHGPPHTQVETLALQ